MLPDLSERVTDVIDRLGYVGVALLVALENLCPPIPSEVVLPFAGFVARDGDASLVGMVLAATVGSTVGAWVLFGISAAIGPDRLRAFLVRNGRWFRLSPGEVDRAQVWFDRHAVLAVLFGRCVPLMRSIVSIPAGFRRMAFVPFTLSTVVGSLIWNAMLIGAGYALREQWHRVEPVLGVVQLLVALAGVAAVGWFVRARVRSPRPRSVGD